MMPDINGQQQRSPMLPQTTQSVDERLAQYRAKYDTQEQYGNSGEAPADAFLPQLSNTVDSQTREDAMDKWLAPVAVDVSTPSVQRTKEDYDHFLDVTLKDPALIEGQGLLMGDEQTPGLCQTLFNAIQQGHMTYDQAMAEAGRFMDKFIVPILDKHHGDKNKPRTYSRARDVAKELGISTTAIASGAKSPADLTINGGA